MRPIRRLGLVIVCVGGMLTGPANHVTYPEATRRRFTIAGGPGGGSDVTAELYAPAGWDLIGAAWLPAPQRRELDTH